MIELRLRLTVSERAGIAGVRKTLVCIVVSVLSATVAIVQPLPLRSPAALANDSSRPVPTVNLNEKLQKIAPNVTQSSQPMSDFPLPVYPRAVVAANFYKTMNGNQPYFAAGLLTRDPPDTAYAWYKQVLLQGGWALSASNSPAGHLMLRGTKGNVTATIKCVKRPKGREKNNPSQNDLSQTDLTAININTLSLPTTSVRAK